MYPDTSVELTNCSVSQSVISRSLPALTPSAQSYVIDIHCNMTHPLGESTHTDQ